MIEYLKNNGIITKDIQPTKEAILAVLDEIQNSRPVNISYLLAELSQNELGEIARQIRYRFSSDLHQIARVIGVSYDTAIKLLETVEL